MHLLSPKTSSIEQVWEPKYLQYYYWRLSERRNHPRRLRYAKRHPCHCLYLCCQYMGLSFVL